MIYMTEFSRVTMRVTSQSQDCGLTSINDVPLVFGSNHVSLSKRMVIYHRSETEGVVFSDHDLFSIDRTVNSGHTQAT